MFGGVQCPLCKIDLAVPPGADRFRCGQCGSVLAVATQQQRQQPSTDDEDLRRALVLSTVTAEAEAKPGYREEDAELKRVLAMSAGEGGSGGGGSGVAVDGVHGVSEEEELHLAMALSAAEAKESTNDSTDSAKWEWENESKEGGWLEFDGEACTVLEEAAARGREHAIVTVHGLRFDADLRRMTQHDAITGMKCRIRRRDVGDGRGDGGGARGHSKDEHKPEHKPSREPHPHPPELARQLSTDSYEQMQVEAQREAAFTMARIKEWHAATSEKFVDTDFRPCEESLYGPNHGGYAKEPWTCGACNTRNAPTNQSCAGCRMLRYPVARWLRADELVQMTRGGGGGGGRGGGGGGIGELWSALLGVPQRVAQRGSRTCMSPFGDGGRAPPCPSDIMQGALGDCWLLSAMAVLAERPELVRRVVFDSGRPNPAGAYQLRLCKDGEWRTVTLDDVFPCTADGRLAYSKAAGDALWVPLIEKALAKLHGSYKALTSGTMAEGLALLTGAPCESVEVESRQQRVERKAAGGGGAGGLKQPPPDLEELWGKVLSWRSCGFLVGASCGGSSVDSEAADAMGLHTRHAYSVLDVQGGYTAAGPPFRLLKLRNPWGSGEWRGDWSDGSPLWARERELATRLRPEGRRDDGVFWMSFDDFATFFTRLDVAKVRLDWTEVRGLGGNFVTAGGEPFVDAFELEPLEAGAVATDTALVLSQRSTRGAPSAAEARQVDMGLCVLREHGGGEWEFVADAPREVASSVCAEALLEGDGAKYVVLPLGFNQMLVTARAPFALAVHSAKPMLVRRMRLGCSAYARALVERAKRRGKVETPFEHMQVYTLTQDGGIMIVAVNSHPRAAFCVELDCSDSFNLVSSRGSLLVTDAIQPMHAQLLLVMSVLEESGGYRWSLQANFRSTDGRLAPSHSPAVEPLGIHAQIALPSAGGNFFAPAMAREGGGIGAPGLPDCRMQ